MNLRKLLFAGTIIILAFFLIFLFSPGETADTSTIETIFMSLICAIPIGVGLSVSLYIQVKRGQKRWERSISKADIPEWLKKFYKWLYGIEEADQNNTLPHRPPR